MLRSRVKEIAAASVQNEKRTIESVNDLNRLREEIAQGKSTHGTGGMKSKVEAAEILQKAGIETWIVNGLLDNFILKALQEKVVFTKIVTV